MNKYITIRNQYCPNKFCLLYEQKLMGNVATHSRKYKRFRCKICNKTWVMHFDQAFYGMRTDFEKVEAALNLLAGGLSIRKTAQRIDVNPNTVQRWKFKFQKIFTT